MLCCGITVDSVSRSSAALLTAILHILTLDSGIFLQPLLRRNLFIQICLCTVLDTVLAANKLARSEEHTSELQSRPHLVCRLLLEKKNEPTQIVDDHLKLST